MSAALDSGRSVTGFVLSLDFELMWGVKGSRTTADYAPNVHGGRRAVPRLLELFDRHAIGCTWATVGLMFFEDRDTMMAGLPSEAPRYPDPRLSAWSYFHEVGPDERRDPLHFGLSLIRQIAACPGQEIATQTFSHLYCLERGVTCSAFSADLAAAVAAARKAGLTLRTLVFPRNQVNQHFLPIARKAGIDVYRGNAPAFFDRPTSRAGEGLGRRVLRLADSYVALGPPARVQSNLGMTNVQGSLFFRPYRPGSALSSRVRLARIVGGMRRAARRGELFHLWFHPHNIGVCLDENLAIVSAIVTEAARLRDAFGWQTLGMAALADAATALHEAGTNPLSAKTVALRGVIG